MLAKKITRRASKSSTSAVNDNVQQLQSRLGEMTRRAQDVQRRASNQNSRSVLRRKPPRVLKRVVTIHPLLRAILTLQDIEGLVNQHQLHASGAATAEGFADLGNWYVLSECANPSGSPMAYLASTTLQDASPHFANNCLGGQAFPDVPPLQGDAIFNHFRVTDNTKTVHIGGITQTDPVYRGEAMVSYSRPDTGSHRPTYVPAVSAFSINLINALPSELSIAITARPELSPVASVMPAFTQAVPYKHLPDWNNNPHREVSNGASSARYTDMFHKALEYSIIHTNGRELTHPKSHHKARPPQGTKEQKIKMAAPAIAVLKFVNFATESLDAIAALYDALPDRYQARWKNTQYRATHPSSEQQLRALYDNWEHIKIVEGINNLITNEIEDRIIGEIGKANADASKRLGIGYGQGFNTLSSRIRNISSSYAGNNDER